MKLLETALYKLVAITKLDAYEELMQLVSTDLSIKESLIEIDKLVNWNYASTTKSFSKEYLFALTEIELDSLIKTFTLLDGQIQEFTFDAQTPVPCLFSRLRDLNYQNFNELADWVFKKRSNKFIFPFGWERKDEAKSLKEYLMFLEKDKISGEIYRLQNNLKSIEKKINNPDKATNNLKDAIKRKDWRSFDALIKRGADLNETYEDGKALSEKIKEIKGGS